MFRVPSIVNNEGIAFYGSLKLLRLWLSQSASVGCNFLFIFAGQKRNTWIALPQTYRSPKLSLMKGSLPALSKHWILIFHSFTLQPPTAFLAVWSEARGTEPLVSLAPACGHRASLDIPHTSQHIGCKQQQLTCPSLVLQKQQ